LISSKHFKNSLLSQLYQVKNPAGKKECVMKTAPSMVNDNILVPFSNNQVIDFDEEKEQSNDRSFHLFKNNKNGSTNRLDKTDDSMIDSTLQEIQARRLYSYSCKDISYLFCI
jgi:hypothetical protein